MWETSREEDALESCAEDLLVGCDEVRMGV
jgi:hypothetical protein